jgi:hypothetical protein
MTVLKDNLAQFLLCSGRIVAFMLGVIVLFAAPCVGQASVSTNNGSQLPRRIPQPRQIDDPSLDGPSATIFYQKRIRAINAAQHQSLVADTDRLVKLVAELNAQINSSHASSLTPEQLRTVAEVEKLAHSVRDKMRMTVRSAADFTGPAATPFAPR